jgi:hypothetical protein
MRSLTISGISCARSRRRTWSLTILKEKLIKIGDGLERRPLRRLPDSRGRCCKNAVCRHSTASGSINRVRRFACHAS